MELKQFELAVIEEIAVDRMAIEQLEDSVLAMIGGGSGEVILQ